MLELQDHLSPRFSLGCSLSKLARICTGMNHVTCTQTHHKSLGLSVFFSRLYENTGLVILCHISLDVIDSQTICGLCRQLNHQLSSDYARFDLFWVNRYIRLNLLSIALWGHEGICLIFCWFIGLLVPSTQTAKHPHTNLLSRRRSRTDAEKLYWMDCTRFQYWLVSRMVFGTMAKNIPNRSPSISS